MDGASIAFVTAGLFLARAYGVTVPAEALVSLLVTVVLLSLGAPRGARRGADLHGCGAKEHRACR
jgi:Na+/H+-dicarboxylate symporter